MKGPISQGCSEGDDWMVKEFMWEQGIPFWTDIHHRICGLFTTAGALVYYVESMDYSPGLDSGRRQGGSLWRERPGTTKEYSLLPWAGWYQAGLRGVAFGCQ